MITSSTLAAASSTTSSSSSTTTTGATDPPTQTQQPQQPQNAYHIEVSNVARPGMTQIVVTGPGVLGLLASLCVTLATRGGSIKELHAADVMKEGGMTIDPSLLLSSSSSGGGGSTAAATAATGKNNIIRDVITVIYYPTKTAFPDSELKDLALALLHSIQSPKTVVSAFQQEMDKIYGPFESTATTNAGGGSHNMNRITVIPKDRFRRL